MALVQDFVLCTRCYWTNVIIMCVRLARVEARDALLAALCSIIMFPSA